MKLICFPHQSPHFYLKPDTAILRNGNAFYIPDSCSRLSGALAIVIKINRLGRHIDPKFASRYYSEAALGFCIYAADILEQNRAKGAAWGEACCIDNTAPLSEHFLPVSTYPINGCSFSWEAKAPAGGSLLSAEPESPSQWQGATAPSLAEPIITNISKYIFLKMGDLLWIELHPPLPLHAGEEICAFQDKKERRLQFSIK